MHSVIYVLIRHTFCILIKSNSVSDIIRAYIGHTCAKFGGTVKLLSDHRAEFINELFYYHSRTIKDRT